MVIIDSYVCLGILINTRRCITVNLRLTKKLFQKIARVSEKFDQNKIRLRAVGGNRRY